MGGAPKSLRARSPSVCGRPLRLLGGEVDIPRERGAGPGSLGLGDRQESPVRLDQPHKVELRGLDVANSTVEVVAARLCARR
jgi:hypothetical protein